VRLVVILLLLPFTALLVGLAVSAVVQRRLTATGGVESALRADHPTTWARPGEWRHGLATAGSGGLRFRPGCPLGMRLPRGAPVDIEVLAAQVEEGRRPSLRQAWSINPALHIATLTTPDGPIELAAPARSLTNVIRVLQPPR
jgi:hypothetical protein